MHHPCCVTIIKPKQIMPAIKIIVPIPIIQHEIFIAGGLISLFYRKNIPGP